MTSVRAWAVAVLTALSLVLAACGGDSENAAEPLPTTPKLTVPGDEPTPEVTKNTDEDAETETDTSTTTTDAAPTQTTPQANPTTPSGGAAAPQTGGATPDTEQNDQPPPADSPASEFEQFCQDNPGAC